MAGVLEAITRAIGGLLNELGGVRFTRSTVAAAVTDTTLTVETTNEWPDSGVIVVNSIVHLYASKTLTTLDGITHFEGVTEVTGLKGDVAVLSDVIDFSREFSDLDKLRLSLFVDSAVGADLSTLGRNLGVGRPPELSDDDVFREVIKALAYTPKGTIYALELALTAFFGAGNFEVYENLVVTPNTVFIRITGGILLLTTVSEGKAYVGVDLPLALDDAAKEVTLAEASLVGIFASALLADELGEFELLTQLPSVFTEIRYTGDAGIAVWTFSGTGSEGVEVANVAADDGVTQFDMTGGAASGLYTHHARIQPESANAYLDAHLRFAALTSNGNQNFTLDLADGARLLRIVFEDAGGGDVAVGFGNSSGNFIAGSSDFTADEYATYAIHKKAEDLVALTRNGVVVQTLAHASFSATTETSFVFGVTAATELPDIFVKSVNFNAETSTDYWNVRGTVADTLAAAPSTLDTNSANLLAADVGSAVRTFDSQVTNAQGGNNNGTWVAATFVDVDKVTLVGREKDRAFVETAHVARVTVVNDDDAFKFPDDQGKTLEVLGAGPNAGSSLATHVLDTLTGFPFQPGEEGASGECLVVGAATGTSGTNGAVSSGAPDRFVDATASAFVPGDIGRVILVPLAANPTNTGVFQITAYISADEVEVNSVSIGQSFVTETTITWELRESSGYVTESGLTVRLDPNFVDETGTLAWELSDAGSVAGLVATLRDNPPFNFTNIELIMRVRYTMVLSAQALIDSSDDTTPIPATDPVEYTHYPFFLPSSTLGAFEAFIDELTVAGVIPEVSS